MAHHTSVLIIGAGQAASVLARELRGLGYSGSITVVGEETHLPYERPPLSKDVLKASASTESVFLQKAEFYQEQNIELVLGTSVHSLDCASRQAHLSNGQTWSFEHAVLATGGAARELALLPATQANALYLRTLDDALRVQARLHPGVRVLVIGGGFMGLELASTAHETGAQVTVVEANERLLARNAPALLSHWLLERFESQGITVCLGQGVSQAHFATDKEHPVELELKDGQRLQGDVALVAAGLTANSALARASGIAVDEMTAGIIVDRQGRTSVAGIYAAGDCTTQICPETAVRTRTESWQNANEQARQVAHVIAAQPAPAAPVSWFWTDVLGCNIQMLGQGSPDLDYQVRGVMDSQADAISFMLLAFEGPYLRHAIAVNAGADLRALRSIMEQNVPVDPAIVLDPSTKLRQYVKEALRTAHV
ncbi:FAD-dependent oxidoreductase [Alcaligenes ammonioxydans]|uniref:NAD(P)/FAD-dependent oxidoreductase n=1 Tax=Alcaligenes ammonioxydans TaxID=2582914 RepID=UPI001F055C1A|nr:FAD-dependent oxidoreductase [Alcaligenes ammonioxydans]MCH1881201.1 FAD-dependent oxidoreductase [Alcaligenes ammonioxydans]UZH23624.1 FAD-dependent oxidoreductase [Alcaligenes faecalis]